MGHDDDWTKAGGESADPASREAALWFATLNGDDATDTDRAAFRTWLQRDPANAREYAAIERLWGGLSELPEVKQRRRAKRVAVTRRNLGKAALASVIGGGAWWAASQRPFAEHRSGKGERRNVTLADGSVVELATETALSTRFDDGERRVELHFGEAYFSVVRDVRRPFVVEAGVGAARALGTRFSVANLDGEVRVAVDEGKVEFSRGADRVLLSGGSGATMDDHGIGAVSSIDPVSEFAWRDGRLVFISARLDNVVEALNRWRSGRIILTDPTLARRPVTIIVDLERTGEALSALAGALPIRLLRLTAYVTVIMPA
ncbi:FecR family protein [Hansschlegelia quercus]|uniref:FecR family protein n=1 Tax=Hansschlegelia quercus TaxID=2528245 RepID=A0A4Q9GJQ8_9HYPH|nr:FecR family protein [Hansschlegelia quercus]TBN53521.1 FecR family protein [Hansschlegelia quercus]